MSVRWIERRDQADVLRVSFAVKLRDLVTGDAPLGEPAMVLEREGPANQWTRVETEAVRTASAMLAHLKLERKASAVGVPPAQYRFTITSPLYVPRFRAWSPARDWESVTIPPYDDAGISPPAPSAPIDVDLCPSLLYPFAAHVPVIRGRVTDKNTLKPLPDTLVFGGPSGRAITDAEGRYGLPLIGAPPNVNVVIGATDRQGRQGQANVTLPAALLQAVNITIPP